VITPSFGGSLFLGLLVVVALSSISCSLSLSGVVRSLVRSSTVGGGKAVATRSEEVDAALLLYCDG